MVRLLRIRQYFSSQVARSSVIRSSPKLPLSNQRFGGLQAPLPPTHWSMKGSRGMSPFHMLDETWLRVDGNVTSQHLSLIGFSTLNSKRFLPPYLFLRRNFFEIVTSQVRFANSSRRLASSPSDGWSSFSRLSVFKCVSSSTRAQ